MFRSKNFILVTVFLFLLAETFLGICIFQLRPMYGEFLRFLTIVVACLFCFLFIERSWLYVLTQFAFMMTLCGDGFLALPPEPIQIPGVLCFLAAQFAYAVRLFLSEKRPSYRRMHLIVRALGSVLFTGAVAVILRENIDVLALLSVFYYINLVLNFCFSCTQFREQKAMAIGFFFFMLSDLVLGLDFMEPYFALAEDSVLMRILQMDFDFIWAFYIPAQISLAFSLLSKRWKSIPHHKKLHL